MTFISKTNDPFYAILSKCLSGLRGTLALSLTDRRGDIIAQVAVAESDGAPSDEEVGLIHVYGQLAYQQAPDRLSEVTVERGARRWRGHRIYVDQDFYDLWAVCINDPHHAATLIEISQELQSLEAQLIDLLRGEE